jgi:hypothetical protein
MEQCSALSVSLARQVRWRKITISFSFFQGDYWEDGTVFRPERFLDEAGALKKDNHLIPILSGDYWEDGTVLRPELFLDAASVLKKDDYLIPIFPG